MWPFRKAPHATDGQIAPVPEDWRDTEETAWLSVAQAGDYDCQHLAKKQVRFPDGETRWFVNRYGSNGPIERMVKMRGR